MLISRANCQFSRRAFKITPIWLIYFAWQYMDNHVMLARNSMTKLFVMFLVMNKKDINLTSSALVDITEKMEQYWVEPAKGISSNVWRNTVEHFYLVLNYARFISYIKLPKRILSTIAKLHRMVCVHCQFGQILCTLLSTTFECRRYEHHCRK